MIFYFVLSGKIIISCSKIFSDSLVVGFLLKKDINKKITLFHKRAIPRLHYTNGKVDK